MTDEILTSLEFFCPIGLSEMDNIRLMNRIDTKYLIPVCRIPELLKRMDGNYRVLEIKGERISSYNNIYLDTPDFVFFSQHIRGIPGRCKVRFRTYLNTGKTFLEIKKKTSGNRTVKWRIVNRLTAENNCDSEAMGFLDQYLQGEELSLQPVISNEFRRITFVDKEMNERMTLDFDLTYRCNGSGLFDLAGIAIIELKKNSFPSRSNTATILKNIPVRPTGFSKYCIGVSALCNVEKKNILKPKFMLINKIRNENDSCLSTQ